MLQSLQVRNLAIVESAAVEFAAGLNVITGETGAGKSILVGALDLVLGGRADKTLIRAGEQECRVEAVFQLADPTPVDAVLKDLELEPCREGTLIVRRTVSVNGAGRQFVNDSPTTLALLKRLGDLLVDMHGPHDHQSLLGRAFQMELLDAFGHHQSTRDAYAQSYRAWHTLQDRRRALDADDQTVAQQVDILSYQVKELEEADLTGRDEDALVQEHTATANAQRILELTGTVQAALTEADGAALTAFTVVQKQLAELANLVPAAGEWRQEAATIAVQIKELADTVTRYASHVEGDPARLQALEERMALVHRLKRKYGGSVAAALATLQNARERLRDLTSRHERIAELDRELVRAEAAVREAGRLLGRDRRKAAKALAKSVTAELRALGFAQGGFEVTLTDADPGPSGADEIEFGFMPNVGEPVRPLRTIASSGEISRVMLAVKTVLAEHDRIPVLVFDEIDANVGGETGKAVGDKLRAVATAHQVLCITHLPQVAMYGGTHYVVAKRVQDGRTLTQIRRLDDSERVEELARMLGGRDLTSVTLKHAREMLKHV